MKPNTIELDEKGIFCYEAPQKYDPNTSYRYQDVIDGIEKEKKAIEAAKRERVYFKEHEADIDYIILKKLLNKALGVVIEQGKPYPIPDGYDVKIETECDPNAIVGSGFIKYAILVPKEKENGANVSRIMGYDKPNQQSIEEAAVNSWNSNGRLLPPSSRSSDYMHGFIAGAKSQMVKTEELLNLIITFIDKLETANRDVKPCSVYGEWYTRFVKRFEQLKQQKP